MTNSWKKRLFAAFVALSMMVGDLPASFIADSGRVYAEEKPETVQAEALPPESSELTTGAAPEAVLAAEIDTQEKVISDAPQEAAAGSQEETAVASANQEAVLTPQENAAPEVLLQGAAVDTSVIPEEQQPASEPPQETVPEATVVQSASETPQEPTAEAIEVQSVTPETPEETPDETKQTEVENVNAPVSDPTAAGGETPETPNTPDTPDTPDTPETPNTPDTPDTPDTPTVPEVPQENTPDESAAVTEPAATEPEEKQDNQETEKTAGAEAGNEPPSETAVQEQQPEGENPPQPTGNDGANQPQENHPDQPQQPNNGESAGGETTPAGGQSGPQIPVIPMDAEMEVGDEEKVSVSITGAMVRLKVSKKDTLIMTATGMEAWVDIVKEGEKKSERYMPENGELTVRFEVTPGSYIMTFAPVKASDEGKLTIRVRTEEEVLAELLGEGQDAETDENGTPAGEEPGTTGEAPAGEEAGEVGATGADDGAGESDVTGTDDGAVEGDLTGTDDGAVEGDLTGTDDGTGEGDLTGTDDETGTIGDEAGEGGENELTGEAGATPENGEAVEGMDETGNNSGEGDEEQNPQDGDAVSFDEALAALEEEESTQEKEPAEDAGVGQAPEDDAGDITFIDNAEQPAPAAQEKPEEEADAGQNVEPKDGEPEEPISPDELNPDQEATPSDSETDGDAQPETQETPEVTEVDGDDLNISAYSAEQADAMALALGLKPRLLKKNSALRQKNTLTVKPEETPETESGEKAEPETATETGFAAFDISLKEDAEVSPAGAYLVHVNLSEPVVLPQKENMEITGVSYELYHIPAESGFPTRVEAEFSDNREEGLLYGFTFETDGFSDYLLKYTVDFTYIVVKPDEPEEPVQEPEVFDYEYTFAGKDDTQPIGMILAANELFLDSYTAAVKDDTLVTIDEDLNATAVEFFDATVLTVTDSEGVEYRILLHNPAPAAAEPTEVNATVESYDESATKALVEQYGLGIEVEEGNEDKVVNYAAFDITLSEDAEPSEGGYIVPVTLETPIDLPAKEGTQNKVTYELFHITENGPETVEILTVTDNDGAGPITGFTFKTDGFSNYVLRYTVDFVVEDEQGEVRELSLDGNNEWPLEGILVQLGIEFEKIESAMLELIETVGDKDIDEEGRDALYLDGDSEIGYTLHSYAAFNDVYKLTLVTDGKTYAITVTDEQQFTINFYNKDGSAPIAPDLSGYLYIGAADGWPGTITWEKLSLNEYSVSASIPDSYTSLRLSQTNYNNGAWWNLPELNDSPLSIGNFTITRVNQNVFKAVKQPTYSTEITYYQQDGTTEEEKPSFTAGYYIVAKSGNDWKYYAEIGTDGSLTWRDSSGASVTELTAISEFKLCKPDNTNSFDSIKNANAITETEMYTFTGLGTNPTAVEGVYQFVATKKPAYSVTINFVEADNTPSTDFASLPTGSFYIDATTDGVDRNGSTIPHYASIEFTPNSTVTKEITTFTANNSNGHAYVNTDNVTVQIKSGANYQYTYYGNGGMLGDFGLSYEVTGADSLTITAKKVEPYQYTISEASTDENQTIAFDTEYKNTWYLLSTLKKQDGSTYYYAKQVQLDGQKTISGEIDKYFNHQHNDGEISITAQGNEQGYVSTKFQPGDTVTNTLVRVNSTDNLKINDLKGTAAERFNDGDIANKYTVKSESDNDNGIGTTTLTKLPELKLKTIFQESNGGEAPSPIPSDYYLLVKMEKDGKTYYTVIQVEGHNQISSSGLVFYEYSNSTLSTTPHYYSGKETITTQVITGLTHVGNQIDATDIKNAIEGTGVVKYNPNVADSPKQNNDLTKNLYSTASVIDKEYDPYLLTTTFTRQENGGVEHEITVNFYEEAASPLSNAEKSATLPEAGTYYFLIKLYKKDNSKKQTVAYRVVEAKLSELNNGSYTKSIAANDAFKLADDKEIDISNADPVYYDPDIYHSSVRLYKLTDSSVTDVTTMNIQQAESKGTDTFDNFEFWYNKPWYKNDAANYNAQAEGTAGNYTKTRTQLGLIDKTNKIYQVKVLMPTAVGSVNVDQNLKLNEIVTHAGGGEDKLENAVVSTDNTNFGTNGSTGAATTETINGTEYKVVTYLLENQSENHWDAKAMTGENINPISGNESFELWLTQNGNKVLENFPVKINGNYYSVNYDTRTKNDDGTFVDDNVVVNGKNATITHYVRLTEANYDKAIDPYDVLGKGAEYGVVADKYTQTMHTETNFAVRTFDNSADGPLEVDASGDKAIPFYVDSIVGRIHFGQNNTSDPDVYTPVTGKTNPYVHSGEDEGNDLIHQDSYSFPVTVIPTSSDTVQAYIDILQQKQKASSGLYVSKGIEVPNSGNEANPVIDTTMFPDNKTIYVNVDPKIVTTNGWVLNKLPGQSVVFNIPGDTVTISHNKVKIYDFNNNGQLVLQRTVDGNTGANGGNEADNTLIENDILNHVVFNAFEATTLVIDSGPSGLFLAPYASKAKQAGGSGCGWVAVGGEFYQGQGEWHFFRTQRHYEREDTTAHFTASKFMNRMDSGEYQKPTKDQVFSFVMEHLDWNTGLWLQDYNFKQKNHGSAINFPELSYGIAEEGTHYYRIRELYDGASSKYAPDPRQFFVKVDVTATVKGDHDANSPSTGYSDVNKLNGYEIAETMTYYVLDPETNTQFDEENFYTNNDSQTIHETRVVTMNDGSTQIEPLKTTRTVVRHGLNLSQLEKAKKLDGSETSSSTSPSEAIVFINRYIGKYCVAVTKEWLDSDNRDGVRPDGIIVELQKYDTSLNTPAWVTVEKIAPKPQYKYTYETEYDEETNQNANVETTDYVNYVILNEANNWTHMVKGVDKFDENGRIIQYRWVEKALLFDVNETPEISVNDGSYSSSNATVINGSETARGSEDKEDIITTFSFYRVNDGETVVASVSESEKKNYTEVSYVSSVRSIDERTNPDDEGTVTFVTGLTNTHSITTTQVKATKEWKDINGTTDLTSGQKPVTFRLFGKYTVTGVFPNDDGTTSEGTRIYEVRNLSDTTGKVVGDITLDGTVDNSTSVNGELEAWVATWNNLPKYYNGHLIHYYVVEVMTPDGFTSTYIDKNGNVADEAANAAYLADDGIWKATVRNTVVKGSLTIDKSVIIDNKYITEQVKDGDTAKNYYVVISQKSGEGSNARIYYVTGTNTGTLEEKNLNTLSLDSGVFGLNFEPATSDSPAHYTLTVTNLPVGEYTVQEVVEVTKEDNTKEWQLVSGSNAAILNVGHTQFVESVSKTSDAANTGETAELINIYTNSKYCVVVTKQWMLNGKTYVDDSLEIYAQLQRRAKGETDWTPVTGVYMGENVEGGNTAGAAGNNYIKLSKANNWSAVAVGMDRKNENGVEYEYQWVEGTVSGTTFTAGVPAGWTLAGSETVQSKNTETAADANDGVELIFLTKLVNTKATAQPQITKTVTATYAAAPAGTYTFTLEKGTGDNRPTSDVLPADPATVSVTMPEVAAGKSASMNGIFDAITYTEAGTYTYTITETAPTGTDTVEGMVYDTKTVAATVEVSADEDGKLIAGEFTYTNNGTFINEFKPAKISIPVKKAFSTAGLADDAHAPKGNYVFTIEGKTTTADGLTSDTMPVPAQDTVVLLDVNEVTAEAARTATFTDIVYTKVGTYTYEIKELLTDAQASGWKYDTKTITATVTVKANSDGSLGATVEYADADGTEYNSVTFTNIYELVKISAIKAWDGNATNYGLKKDVQLTIEGTVDAGEGKTQYITEYLAGAGDTLVKTIPANAEDTALTVTWENLPKYYDGKEITYKVIELNTDGFTTAYSSRSGSNEKKTGEVVFDSNNSGAVTVTNTVELGALKVSKKVFVNNADKTSDNTSKEFYVKVKAVINGETYWVTGSSGELTKASASVTIANAHKFTVYPGTDLTLNNIPVGTYTVYEVDADGNPITENTPATKLTTIGDNTYSALMSTTEATAEVAQGTTPAAAELVNHYTNGKYCIAVTKQWLVNGKVSVPDDQTLIVQLQRTTTPENEASYERALFNLDGSESTEKKNTVELNKGNNWSAVAIGMDQMNDAGQRYTYRWVEMNGNTPAMVGSQLDGWMVGKAETIQSATKDGTQLIFLTRLTNSKAEAEIPVKKVLKEGSTPYTGNARFKVALTKSNATTGTQSMGGTNGFTVTPDTPHEVEVGINDIEKYVLSNFNQPGKYVFTLTESAVNPVIGFTYDTTPRTVTVTVAWHNGATDNTKGDYLTATVKQGSSEVDAEHPVTFENEYNLGKLKVVKTFDFGSAVNKPTAAELARIQFKVTGYQNNDGEKGATIYDETTLYLVQMTRNGESYEWSAELDHLPFGIYTVTESLNGTVLDNFDYKGTSITVDGSNQPVVAPTVDAPINKDTMDASTQEETVTLTNSYEPKQGELQISKKVVNGLAADSTKQFDIEISVLGASVNGNPTEYEYYKPANAVTKASDKITFTGNKATVQLAKDESIRIVGLPAGAAYTVAEAAASREGFDVLVSPDQGNLGNGTAVAVTVTNTRKTADLSLTKTVDSTLWSDEQKEFNFTITFSETMPETVSVINGTFSDDRKAVTATLKTRETVSLTKVPQGVTYTVSEVHADGFTESMTVNGTAERVTMAEGKAASGDIILTADAVIDFTNKKDTGKLAIHKTVQSALKQDETREFKFKVYLFTADDSVPSDPVDGTGTTHKLTFKGVLTRPGYNGFTLTREREIVFTTGESEEIVLKHDETMTIEGIPAGFKYYVVETPDADFSTASTNAGTEAATIFIVKGETGTAQFTNTRKVLPLKLEKKVVSPIDEDSRTFYDFTVRLLEGSEVLTSSNTSTDSNYYSVKYYTSDGAEFTAVPDGYTLPEGVTSLPDHLALSDGEAHVYVIAGGYTVLENLPKGVIYTVNENIDNTFAVETTNDGKGTLTAENTTVKTTNTRKTGDLVVSKTVNSNQDNDKNIDFGFVVELYETYNAETQTGTAANLGIPEGATKTYGGMTFQTVTEEGKTRTYAEFTLRGNSNPAESMKKAEGLPIGLKYVVTETDSHGMVQTSTGEIGEITGGNNEAKFTNTRANGGLVVSKSVISELSSDKTKDFHFTLTLFDGAVDAEGNHTTRLPSQAIYVTIRGEGITTETTASVTTNADGQYSFNLKNGQIAVFSNIPIGAYFTVEEQNDAGFTTTKRGDVGTIRDDAANLAEFVNTAKPGELKIQKTVVSPIAADRTKTFRFNVKLFEPSDNTLTGDALTAEGNRSYLSATIAGRYFDGTNGADFYVMGTQTLTLDNIPAGVYYEVTEVLDDARFHSEAVTPVTGKIQTLNAEKTNFSLVHYKNTRTDATLILEKNVVSTVESDKNIDFTYTIVFNESITGEFEVVTNGTVGGASYKANGTVEGLTDKPVIQITAGRATVTLSDGAKMTVKGLPIGTEFTIVEAVNNSFDAAVYNKTSNSYEETNEFHSTVDDKNVPEAIFRNTRKTGSLSLTKMVSSSMSSDAEKPFTFNVIFDRELDNTGNTMKVAVDGTDTTFTLAKESKTEDGTTTTVSAIRGIKLKHQQTAVISGLPAGVTYTITEDEANQGGFVTTSTGETGTISAYVSRATFTNTKQVGGLIVSKAVDSTVAADKANTKTFHYTVTITDPAPADLGITAGQSRQFGAMTFELKDGKAVAEFDLSDGGSTYATDLPEGTKYTIVETNDANMTIRTAVASVSASGVGTVNAYTGNPPEGIIHTGTTASVAYTNIRKTANLQIEKEVQSDNPADQGKSFQFEVTLTVNNLALPGTFGGYSFDAAGKCTITLHGGDKVVLTDLPVGTFYTIVETEASATGFIPNPSDRTISGKLEVSDAGNPITAKFTNTRETGKLIIEKKVESSLSADNTREYEIKLYLDAEIGTEAAPKTYSGISFVNGTATILLNSGNGFMKTIEGLPVGAKYSVAETPVEGMSVSYTNQTGTIAKTADGITVTVTNTRENKQLEIDKKVFVNDEDKTGTYSDRTFYVKVMARIGGETYWVTDANGALTKQPATGTVNPWIFSITPGTTTKLDSMPEGEYTVYEVTQNTNGAASVDASHAPTADMGGMLFVAALSQTRDTVNLSGQNGTAQIVNKYTSEKFCVAVTKNWVDDGNKYDTRPGSLTVTLKRYVLNGTDKIFDTTVFGTKSYTLTAANNWTYLVTGVDQFDAQGREYHYVWAEETLAGYAEGAQQEAQTGTYARTEDKLVLITKLNNSLVNADIPVRKIITGDTYTGDEQFEIKLTFVSAKDAENHDITAPDVIPSGAGLSLRENESGIFTLKGIRTPGTYTYRIQETDNHAAGMTYAADQTVTIVVGWNSDTAAEQTHLVVKSIQAEGKDVSATAPVTIENRYERGKLIITKTFSFGNDPEPADFDKSKLTFTISSTDVTGFEPVTVNLGNFTYDAKTKIYSYELKDLVLGEYAVSEAGAERLISNYTLTANGSTSSPVFVPLSRDDGNSANGSEAEKTAAFVNTYTQDKGSLKIKKSISGATLGDLTEAQQKAITFTVTGPNNYTKSFSLFDMGEDLEYIIPDLPIGEYTVTESGADRNVPEGFDYSSTVYSVEDGRQTTVRNEVREVTVTNSYTEKTGELEISKTVISPVAADQEKEFEFTITLTPQVSGDFSGVEFENGTATITLHGDETRIIRGLPSRTVYTVAETETTGFTNTEKTGDTGTISQTRSSAAFTNTRDQGNLIISKTVISPIPAEMTAEYSFDILLNEKVNGTFGGVTFTDGKASGIMIRGGESKTIEGLPTGVTYTVTEAEYRTFITTSTGASGTIAKEPSEAKFTNDRKTGELEISKTVRSSSAADAEKSFRFTVTLGDTTVGGAEGKAFGDLTFRNGVAEFTLKDGEKATASGLPTGVSYTVEEEKTEGFVTTSVGETGSICLAKSTAAFTNTKAEGGLVVSKKVISAVEADHETEFDVTVTLGDRSIGGEKGEAYGDATFVNGIAELKLKDGDIAVITGLPTGMDYTVKETLTDEDTEAFTIAYNGKTSAKEAEGTIQEDKTASAKVTNIRKTAELTITKKVVSNVAADRTKEAFLFTVELKHGGKAVDGVFSGVTFENGIAQIWLKHGEKAALKGLPYGTEYSVQEATPDRFTRTVEGAETGTLTEGKTIVAYTNTAEYVEKTVKKVWEDNSDSYGKRPKSIAATLKANGEVLKTVVLNKENKWTWTETKLPRYSKGREILYAWEETDVPDGYVMESEAKGNVTTITNTYLTGKLKITKTFSDNVADNPAVKKLTFTIVGPGLNKTVEYSEFRKGEYLLENLIPGVYAVVENNAYGLVSGYTLKAADSVISANGIVTAETDLTLALKNVYEEEKKTEEPPTPGPGPEPGPGPGPGPGTQTGTIVIRKVFTGMTELDDPGNLTFRILGPDGYDERVPYSQFTDGAYTISGLKPGQYLVYEMNAAVLNTAWKLLETSVTTAGGEVAVGQETVFELQNDYEVPTTSTGVMKVWDDMDNLDGSRPASLTVALLQDGRVIRHAALSEGNGWKAEITGLPLFNAAGAVIQYSWREEEVPGYVLSSQIRLGNATVMKNTHKPEVTSVSVTKIWDDNKNEAGLRPASLRVRLSNGTNYTLNEANGWSVTVENLPKYVNGEEVRYTWSEQSVLGYTLTDVRTVGDTTIFTNSYRMLLPPTEDGTPNTGTRLHILEDYGTPLGIEILINHVGDCYE